MSIPMYSFIGEHQSLTGLSSVKTVKVPNGANAVLVQALTQNVRIKFVGNANGVSGFQIRAGVEMRLVPLGGSGSFTVQEETASATFEHHFVHVHDGLV